MIDKVKNAVVIGKFMPPHKGHKSLILFALNFCKKLTVLVDHLEEEDFTVKERVKWLKEEFRDYKKIKICGIKNVMPQDPLECDNFWNIWVDEIKTHVNADALVASMPYGYELARKLGCKFIRHDFDRQSINISATEIKKSPVSNFNFICSSARRDLVKRICFIGPESTGKSTIAKSIAQKLNTIFIPEYAEFLIKEQGGKFYKKNIDELIKCQLASEESLINDCGRFLICDSDIITTYCWGKRLFKKIKGEKKIKNKITSLSKENHYSHTFLFYPDTDWEPAIHRKLKNESKKNSFRLKMFNEMKELLDKNNRKYSVVYGSFEEKERFILSQLKSQECL